MKKSGRNVRRRKPQRRLVIALCALAVMIVSLLYILDYELTRREILRNNAEFSALYQVPTIAPTCITTLPPTSAPTAEPTAEPTPAPTAEPTVEITLAPTASPAPTAAPTSKPTTAPTASPTPSPSPTPDYAVAVDVTRAPLATPDAGTLVIAMETPPPVQESFSSLLEANPEAVGFLNIDNVLSLPVVQRLNDNDFYLDHSFDLEESLAGTLFLDGANLLVPEDDCLVIYGHNMRNGTMFQPLPSYEAPDFLRQNALVRFDTLYEDRIYVPFAALTVTADPDSARYLNLRQFSYDPASFNLFVRSLRTLSVWNSPVEVEYGDHILLLVTCEYTHDNGRFVLALRAQREDEAWDQLWSQVQMSELK